MKIIYNTNFLSKEEFDEINHDNNSVEIIGRDLNPNTPQNDLLHSICLLAISLLSGLPQGLLINYIYDLIKMLYRNFKQKLVSWRDSSNKEVPAVPEIKISNGKGHTVDLILKREPTKIELLNIYDVIKHLKSENYLIQLNEDGRINIWTLLEYGKYRHEQQKQNNVEA